MEIYSKKLIEENIVDEYEINDLEKKYKLSLEQKLENSKKDNNIEITPFMEYEWKGFGRVKKDKMQSQVYLKNQRFEWYQYHHLLL